MATTAEIAVFVFCLIGCGYHCWALGKREGIEGTVQYLIDTGVIAVEDEIESE